MNRNRLKFYRNLSLGAVTLIVSLLLLITRPGLADAQNEIHINWRELPVLPSGISAKAREILKDGLINGYDPHSFSKIGDCYASTSWFIADFDLGKQYYNLGPFEADFAPVIDYYQGSFGTHSLAARPGFTAASLLSPTWLNSASCDPHGNPLNCELSAQNSLFAIFSIGTNDAFNPDQFKDNMREAIETAIAQNRLPVLMTKADDIEGGHRINQDIADLAAEYELPIVNFWAAVQDLPQKGLQADGVHLTFYKNDFSDPLAYDAGWTYRNISTLYMLQLIMGETISLENEIAAERQIPEPEIKLAEADEEAVNGIETVLAARFDHPITTIPARQRIANGISNYARNLAGLFAAEPLPAQACPLPPVRTAGFALENAVELQAAAIGQTAQLSRFGLETEPFNSFAYLPEIRDELSENELSVPEILESNHQTLRLIFPLIAFHKESK